MAESFVFYVLFSGIPRACFLDSLGQACSDVASAYLVAPESSLPSLPLLWASEATSGVCRIRRSRENICITTRNIVATKLNKDNPSAHLGTPLVSVLPKMKTKNPNTPASRPARTVAARSAYLRILAKRSSSVTTSFISRVLSAALLEVTLAAISARTKQPKVAKIENARSQGASCQVAGSE